MHSHPNSERQSQLLDKAIDWLVRLRSEELSEEEMATFANWLAEDYQHSEAFAQAEDLFDEMRLAASMPAFDQSKPGISPLPQAKKLQRRRHRRWLPVTLATAAIWLLAVVLVIPEHSYPLQRLLSDHHTVTGEIREVRLSDGSRVMMNTNTAISLQFDDQRRRVILHHGQASFTVAKDGLRPFEVIAGATISRALGTVFEVHLMDQGNIRLTVQQHSVRFNFNGDNPSIDLGEGQRLQYRNGDPFPSIETVDVEQTSAWQRHRLIINDRPLGELIAELNRYRLGRIFLADRLLSNQRVSGAFSLEKPDEIPASIAAVLGLRETRINNWWTILHR